MGLTQIHFSLFSIVDILSIATSLVLGSFFILSAIKGKKANVFLGLFLWSLAIEILQAFIFNFLENEFIIIQTALLTLVFLFFYVQSILGQKIKQKYILLFIPFLIENLAIFVPVLHIAFNRNLEYLFNLLILAYLLFVLVKHQKQVNEFYSEIESKNLAWIKTIIYIYLYFHVFWIIEDIVSFQSKKYLTYFINASNLLTFFMVYWIGYNGFLQTQLFLEWTIEEEENKALSDTKNQEENLKSISENEQKTALATFEKFKERIKEEKLFLAKDITLRSLSKQLGINERIFSKMIKEHTQNNFYHYINQFRVAEFKQLLSADKEGQFSLLGLAYEAGFSSKSTFYTAFKKIEGKTPLQYKNEL